MKPVDHASPTPSLLDDGRAAAGEASPDFETVLALRLSRREVLQGLGAAAFLLGAGPAPGQPQSPGVRAKVHAPDLAAAAPGFTPVPRSLADTVRLPPGYRAEILCALGDPLDAATPPWRGDGREDAASFSRADS